MYLKEVRIKNFRSIIKASLALNNISMFVGLNDVGKSNVLKALNLFFNDETDYEKKLNFDEDYCKHSPKRKNKAEEIIIEIVFKAPSNYKGSKDIVWTKVWRKHGLHTNPKFNPIRFVDGSNFPSKSKLYSWLQNIRFSYIPAIRDNTYFQVLLAKLHDSLAETIETELRDAGDEFIEKIKNNTDGMILEIDKRLNIDSQIKLPSNLQSLFKTLDFSTKEGSFEVSLSNRGDGIKTRHIPVILKFISDQLNINRVKGSPNINMIWGYEEPENNLEMMAAFNLANEFVDYSSDIQLLITTHSPGFYTLKESYPNKINLYKVTKSNGKEAEINNIDNYKDLDNDMGVMPLVAPYIMEKVSEILTLQNDIIKYEDELSKFNKNVVFVEGNDEVRIFNFILKDLGFDDKITVSSDGFGCSGVRKQIMAWAWISGISTYKSFGIFDNDPSGNNEFKKLKEEGQFTEASTKHRVRATNYKVPSHLFNIRSKIRNYPIELEEMYPPKIWEIAEQKGWLENRSIDEINSFVNLDSASQTLKEKIDSFGFDLAENLYVYKKVPDKHKEKLSNFIITDKKLSISNKLEPVIKILSDAVIPFLLKDDK